MDHDELVTPDLAAGADLVDVLEEHGMAVAVAAWVRDADEHLWHFLIAPTAFAEIGRREAYLTVERALAARPDLRARLSSLLVVAPHDPGIRDLAALVRRSSAAPTTRIASAVIGGDAFEDGWVYDSQGMAYQRQFARSLQRIANELGVIQRRGERVFGTGQGIDFLVDSGFTPIAIETEGALSASAVDQAFALAERLPLPIAVVLVTPDDPREAPPDPTGRVHFLQWRSADDDGYLRDSLREHLGLG